SFIDSAVSSMSRISPASSPCMLRRSFRFQAMAIPRSARADFLFPLGSPSAAPRLPRSAREAYSFPLGSPSAAPRLPRSAREAYSFPLGSPSAAPRRPRSAREAYSFPLGSPSAAPRQSFRGFLDHDAVDAVVLAQHHGHGFPAARGEILADIVRADGQLAVAPVHQHRQPDDARPAQVHEGIHGGADGPAG